jgi:cell division protein FtsA
MTKIKGIRELAQSIFPSMPVRVGKVNKNIEGLFDELKDPAYSTVLGLLLYRAGEHTQYEINFQQKLLHSKDSEEENLNDIKIVNTINKVEDTKLTKHKKEEEQISVNNEMAFSFDDLPDISEENNNPIIKKLTNWAKQLF